ncbi:LysM peptidoglycan-binding domain-containing protein [Enterococcus crotali]|uniref:LysM peptidoglycan-binding domain-containing protein n=1 Tax=Enterococcus crotali TaxID=1453587 RepID=UPI000472A038|nr:LysM peptidoglycan-binding domain-containing protein [Enterococcus crotali]OTP49011.1 hypothetical protein A5881_002716 [Enterococcus termitis]
MKKRIKKKHLIPLVFSIILFSTAGYFMSDSLVLGASVGGEAGTAPVADTTTVAPESAPVAPEVEQSTGETTENSATTQSKAKEVPKEVYVVKDGQTLWEIAQDSGLSVQTLMNKNQLSSSVIVEGQELVFDR